MNKEKKYFYLISALAIIILPLLSYPFGLSTSLGFLAGAVSGVLVISYSHLLVNTSLKGKRGKYLSLSLVPRLALLFAIAFSLALYQEKVSPLTFVFGCVIIIFVMLLSYSAKE